MTGLEEIGNLGLHGAGVVGLYWAIGPAVRAFGQNFGTWTGFQTENLLQLGEKTRKRFGEEGPMDDESVHPRVAKEILLEASWISDDVHQEYLAGLLVGSRSPHGKSERGVHLVRMVSGMTANQIHLHHAVYSAFLASGSDMNPGEVEHRRDAEIWAPLGGFRDIVTRESGEDLHAAVIAVVTALGQLDLLDPIAVAYPEILRPAGVDVDEPYFGTQVTVSGLHLFMWAYGVAPWQPDARELVRRRSRVGPRLKKFELRKNQQLLTEMADGPN